MPDADGTTLEEALRPYELTEIELALAFELSRHEEGLPYGDALKLISGPTLDSFSALGTLLEQGVARRQDSGFVRIEFETLGLDRDAIASVVIPNEAFESLGSPLSQRATNALSSLFEATQPLYIAVETAGRDAFVDFEARADRSLQTVFIYPPASAVPPARGDAYEGAIEDWRAWFRHEPRRKKHTRVLISQGGHPDLYMSLISDARLHYTIWTLTADVRHGQRVAVSRGTSLYKTIYLQFRMAAYRSRPLFKLWPVAWTGAFLRPYGGAVVGIAIAAVLTLVGKGWLDFVAAIVLSVVANAIYETLRARRFEPPELFDKDMM